MNWSMSMLPGIAVMALGAVVAFGPRRQREQVKLAGALIVAAGAALVFLV